jgi:hypothetical protein
VSSSGDDDAWRAIVDNYGERPELPDRDLDEAPGPAPGEPSGATADPTGGGVGAEDRFVPPVPPPVPAPGPGRALAWAGVLGAPLVLLLLVVGARPPSWAAYALVAWFVGGFVYLVVRMPSGPGDPGDDGARV